MLPDNSYQVISKVGEGFYKEKGSKFISFAFPVQSEVDVKSRLEELRKRYFDARHHCYAYVIGERYELTRANDDGEPGHSAGDPILGQIKSNDLTNTLVVVVRYFGGTKLGVSGLINAYKTAGSLAIRSADIEKRHIMESVEFSFPYESTNEVMRMVTDFELRVVDQNYQENCQISGLVKVDLVEAIRKKIKLLNDTGTLLTAQWKSDHSQKT